MVTGRGMKGFYDNDIWIWGPHLARRLRLISKFQANLLGLENSLWGLREHVLFSWTQSPWSR